MELAFANKDLERIESDDPPTEIYPVNIIKSGRRKLNFLRSAAEERDLRNWKSLHFEKLDGKRAGQYSIRLNKKWRMILEPDFKSTPSKVTICEICDYH